MASSLPSDTDAAYVLSLVSGAIIPSVAIVGSVVIAVLLFRAERRSSEQARQQDRQDRLLEGLLANLAFFVSANPLAEPWAAEWRLLRAQVMILQTLPGTRVQLLGRWLALDGERGRGLMARAMATLDAYPAAGPEHVPNDVLLAAMKPAHEWAAYEINSIASWMRGDVDDQRLEDAIAQLTPSPPVSDSIA